MPPLTKNRSHFTNIGRLDLFFSVLETFEHETDCIFEIIEKYLFSDFIEPKTFLSIFFITRIFPDIIFFIIIKMLLKGNFGFPPKNLRFFFNINFRNEKIFFVDRFFSLIKPLKFTFQHN